MSEKSNSRGGTTPTPDIEEDSKPVYQPKFPPIKPSDVKISDNLAKLMAGDKRQVALHRMLSSTADIDNEHTCGEHIQKVFNTLIENYPDTALEKFEEVSYLIKKGEDMSKWLKVDHSRSYREMAKAKDSFISEKMRPLFGKPQAGEDGDEPAETPPVCSIQDLLADQRLFGAAGVGFSQQELFLLQKSLQKLAAANQCSFVRFFGKIRGTQADYYVVEATAEGGEEAGGDDDGEENNNNAEEKDANQEPSGTGVNKYTYFVTNSAFSAWTRLPDLSTTQIEAARKIKFLFSGDLERDITCNPFFFGKEKHLLRAQIARIVHSTMIVPLGQYKLNEETDREIDEVVPEEESKVEPLPSTQNAAKMSAWVHFNASILKNNRTTHLEPSEEADAEGAGDFDPEKAMEEMKRTDPFEPRLKRIELDEKMRMGGKMKQSPWVIRLVGDSHQYVDQSGKKLCHGVVVIRSLTWPGAYTIYSNRTQKTIYVGEGIKFTDKLRPFPLSPPILNLDPTEYGEFVLPEVKVFTPEDISAKVNECFDEIWTKLDVDAADALSKDDLKALIGEVKARLHGKEEPMDVNEDEFAACVKDIDDTVKKEDAKMMLFDKLAIL